MTQTHASMEEVDYFLRAKNTMVDMWKTFQNYVDPAPLSSSWPLPNTEVMSSAAQPPLPTLPQLPSVSVSTALLAPASSPTPPPPTTSSLASALKNAGTVAPTTTASAAKATPAIVITSAAVDNPEQNGSDAIGETTAVIGVSSTTTGGDSATVGNNYVQTLPLVQAPVSTTPPNALTVTPETTSTPPSSSCTTPSTLAVATAIPPPEASALFPQTPTVPPRKNRPTRSPSVPAIFASLSSRFGDGESPSSTPSQPPANTNQATGDPNQPASTPPPIHLASTPSSTQPASLRPRTAIFPPLRTSFNSTNTFFSGIFSPSPDAQPSAPPTNSTQPTSSHQRSESPLRMSSLSSLREMITTMLPNTSGVTSQFTSQTPTSHSLNSSPRSPRSTTSSTLSPLAIPPHSKTPTIPTELSRQRYNASPLPQKPTADWHAETLKIWNRKLEDLPVAIDLPRLCTHISVFDCTNLVHPLPPEIDCFAPSLSQGRPTSTYLNQLLATMAFVLDGQESYDILNCEFGKWIKSADISEQKTAIIGLLTEKLSTSRLSGVLKGINQSILAPANIELRLNMCIALPFKDSQTNVWEIEVFRYDDNIEVIHRRRQVNVDSRKEEEYFEFTWELILLFDQTATTLRHSSINIREFKFGPKTSEDRKQLVTALFHPYMFPNPPKKSKLIFPIKRPEGDGEGSPAPLTSNTTTPTTPTTFASTSTETSTETVTNTTTSTNPNPMTPDTTSQEHTKPPVVEAPQSDQSLSSSPDTTPRIIYTPKPLSPPPPTAPETTKNATE
ncbi:hypothetical protein Pelo_11559 [Pelomyxa schiedti]|nr:hypothetical protein Pelo_11559 [Pelomyxa schiedti]